VSCNAVAVAVEALLLPYGVELAADEGPAGQARCGLDGPEVLRDAVLVVGVDRLAVAVRKRLAAELLDASASATTTIKATRTSSP
jgi:hypothetical protein